MEPTKQDAETMLTGAGAIGSAVRARVPEEAPLYLWTGLVPLFAGLVIDLNRDGDSTMATVAGILAMLALAGFLTVHFLYWRRYRQVRMRGTPKWVEWALAAWSVIALFGLGSLLDGSIDVAYTLGGLLGSVPTLLWAERLRRTA